MVKAVKDIDSINPADCRKSVEDSFSSNKVTEKYLDIYNKILESG